MATLPLQQLVAFPMKFIPESPVTWQWNSTWCPMVTDISNNSMTKPQAPLAPTKVQWQIVATVEKQNHSTCIIHLNQCHLLGWLMILSWLWDTSNNCNKFHHKIAHSEIQKITLDWNNWTNSQNVLRKTPKPTKTKSSKSLQWTAVCTAPLTFWIIHFWHEWLKVLPKKLWIFLHQWKIPTLSIVFQTVNMDANCGDNDDNDCGNCDSDSSVIIVGWQSQWKTWLKKWSRWQCWRQPMLKMAMSTWIETSKTIQLSSKFDKSLNSGMEFSGGNGREWLVMEALNWRRRSMTTAWIRGHSHSSDMQWCDNETNWHCSLHCLLKQVVKDKLSVRKDDQRLIMSMNWTHVRWISVHPNGRWLPSKLETFERTHWDNVQLFTLTKRTLNMPPVMQQNDTQWLKNLDLICGVHQATRTQLWMHCLDGTLIPVLNEDSCTVGWMDFTCEHFKHWILMCVLCACASWFLWRRLCEESERMLGVDVMFEVLDGMSNFELKLSCFNGWDWVAWLVFWAEGVSPLGDKRQLMTVMALRCVLCNWSVKMWNGRRLGCFVLGKKLLVSVWIEWCEFCVHWLVLGCVSWGEWVNECGWGGSCGAVVVSVDLWSGTFGMRIGEEKDERLEWGDSFE